MCQQLLGRVEEKQEPNKAADNWTELPRLPGCSKKRRGEEEEKKEEEKKEDEKKEEEAKQAWKKGGARDDVTSVNQRAGKKDGGMFFIQL